MSNSVAVWFELPANDLDRAQAFYQSVFCRPMPRETMSCGGEMALFPSDGPDACPHGAVVKAGMLKPHQDGALIYLAAGADLAEPLSRVVASGGSVVLPKTSIAPHGFIAVIQDTEGNRVGLHSEG